MLAAETDDGVMGLVGLGVSKARVSLDLRTTRLRFALSLATDVSARPLATASLLPEDGGCADDAEAAAGRGAEAALW